MQSAGRVEEVLRRMKASPGSGDFALYTSIAEATWDENAVRLLQFRPTSRVRFCVGHVLRQRVRLYPFDDELTLSLVRSMVQGLRDRQVCIGQTRVLAYHGNCDWHVERVH